MIELLTTELIQIPDQLIMTWLFRIVPCTPGNDLIVCDMQNTPNAHEHIAKLK